MNLNKDAFKPTLVGLAVCAVSAGVMAEDSATEFELNPIVVSTTLSSETAEESLSSVTTIDSRELERQQPKELSDALSGQPGVNVVRNGGFGKTTGVSTRGTSTESTIFLMDGIRIRSATAGGAPWQFIPPQLLHGIEVVRGPRSSLYGADAVGGVVQGFTSPRPGTQKQGNRAWGEVGGGSFNTRRAGGGVTGVDGNTRYSLQGHVLNTDGTELEEGGDDKGFRNAAGNASLAHEFDDGTRVGLLAFRSQGNTEIGDGDTDFTIQTLGARAHTPITESWESGIVVSEALDRQETSSSFSDSLFETRTQTVRWENTVEGDDQELIFGAEHLVDDVDSTDDFTETSRYNNALVGQWIVRRGPSDLQLSARWDDNEAFSDKVTGGAALGLDVDDTHRVRVSYGTAFRAPTFNDLYFPFTDFGNDFLFEGNPDLKPETSQTAEVGFRGQHRTGFWDLAFYQTYVDDLIDNSLENGVTRPGNIDRARIQGVELTGGLHWAGWELQSAVTLQDPRDQDSGERLPRRTSRSLRLDADYTFEDLSAGITGVFEGDRIDNDGETLPGYGLINLRAGYEFAEDWTASVSAENVLDKDYETAGGFKNPGRAAFLTIRYGAR